MVVRGSSRRTTFTVLTAAIFLSGALLPAHAQTGDVVDLTCGPSVTGPTAPSGTHIVSVVGTYGCGTDRASIGVIVCLEYGGVAVKCAQDVDSNARVVSAHAEYACLPGLWTATVMGVATGGPPGVAAGLSLPLDCDPLR